MRIVFCAQKEIIILYAPVICNHIPPGAGDSGGLVGLKYRDSTFEVSLQCPGYAGLLIPAKTAGEIAVPFYQDIVQCFDGIFAGI